MSERYNRLKYFLQALDFFLLFSAMVLAFYLRYGTSLFWESVPFPTVKFIIYTVLLFSYIFIFRANNLYLKKNFLASIEQVVQILKAVFYLFILYILVSFLFKWTLMEHSRSLLVMFSLFSIIFLIFGRIFVFRAFYHYLTRDGLLKQRIVIVGAGKKGIDFLNKIRENPSSQIEVIGIFDDEPENKSKKILDVPVLGTTGELDFYLQKLRISCDGIYVCRDFPDHEQLLKFITRCKRFGIPVYVNSELFSILADRVQVEEFEDSSTPSIRSANRVYRELVKPFMDFVLSFAVLLVILPFFPPLALAIKLTSKGPVFYRRKAYGKDGRPFIQYKLRTMKMNSDEQIHKQFMEDMILNRKKIGEFKIKNDPRVTRVGKILRKLSLDELPQLYNVLKGDMSLIGPRPSLEYEYRMQRKWHRRRYSVLPGLSGLWQAFGRSSVSYDDMVIMDIYYEENLSLWMDLKIFFQTIPNLILGKGAY